MDILEVLDQVRELLQQKGRVTYRILKRQFALDDEALEELKEQLIDAEEVATDKDSKMLVWTGGETPEQPAAETPPSSPSGSSSPAQSTEADQKAPEGERRQLTVMFCDLVGSTALSEQLDPEELQTVVWSYQKVSAQVIERYDGYIAQYLGDGLLVYFGYPAAHEDDAARAIRAGLEIVTALHQTRSQFPRPVQVRIGIHTGPVVVGQMGGGSRHEQLALGETPNVAARVQGKAEPDEVVISAATQRLVAGLFELEDRGRYELKGISTLQALYRVVEESKAQSRFEVAVRAGLTPFVGRDHELAVLRERWTQAQAGNGQAVLVSGEPGIGKSRLIQELKVQVTDEGATQLEFRCSPYHQNSALSPITEHLQRLLQFERDDTGDVKLKKLQHTLSGYQFPQADTLPLLAAFLSLPHPEGVPPITTSPQKQKELTHAALVTWLLEETAQRPVCMSWEDLHWADPSTLEVLALLLSQVPAARLLVVLTFRPEFIPPWGTHSYLSQLTLSRLDQSQVNAMVERVTGGKALPAEVVQQIVSKTDGVPLFVEELTKMVVETKIVQAVNNHYELNGPLSALAIPATLQDSLMARLDRLTTAKEVAQLGATIGREFPHALLHAVSSLEEPTLRLGLRQLADAELIYQRGLPPQAVYLFKHALIRDTAYESLLKRKRQEYHRQIAQVLEEQFPETVETQPELLAHHYAEAALVEKALPYWQQASDNAVRWSAHAEAINHLTRGLELLTTLPETRERAKQELCLQLTLAGSLSMAKGPGSAEREQVLIRARELCQQAGETPQLFTTLTSLYFLHLFRAEFSQAFELAEQVLRLAPSTNTSASLMFARWSMGETLLWTGKFGLAQVQLEHGIALYETQQYQPQKYRGPLNPLPPCLYLAAQVLWTLGYPDQALKRIQAALAVARELAQPYSLAVTLNFATTLHQLRRDVDAVHEVAEELIALSTEQSFPGRLEAGLFARGWILARQGQGEEGLAQMHQSQAGWQATGAKVARVSQLANVAEVYGHLKRPEEGLSLLTEALTLAEETGERRYEAELYRLKGELTLQSQVKSPESRITEAEECFHKAIDIARQQDAKSWELRAATSLARLWQSQDKKQEARDLLTPVFNWFTEGFDTKDLQDAKVLLEVLGRTGADL